MSHSKEPTVADEELAATKTAGYNPGELKTLNEYTQLDAEDESLARWKASLGLNAANNVDPNAKKFELLTMSLVSPSAPSGAVTIDFQKSDELAKLKNSELVVKEGVEYRVKLSFKVGSQILTGLKYIHVVKRAGIKADKMEEMLGSYGPNPEPYEKTFAPDEMPSGLLARATYSVRSRVTDDDGHVYADWSWTFKIAKDW